MSETMMAKAEEGSAVERRGSGSPLVYLHGFLGEGIGTLAIDCLAESGFEVIRPWLPEFRSLADLEGIDGFEDACFWLGDLLDSEGLDSVALGGLLGGMACSGVRCALPH